MKAVVSLIKVEINFIFDSWRSSLLLLKLSCGEPWSLPGVFAIVKGISLGSALEDGCRWEKNYEEDKHES